MSQVWGYGKTEGLGRCIMGERKIRMVIDMHEGIGEDRKWKKEGTRRKLRDGENRLFVEKFLGIKSIHINID